MTTTSETKETTADRIKNLIQQNGPQCAKDVATALGINLNTARGALIRLAKKKEVFRKGPGCYSLQPT